MATKSKRRSLRGIVVSDKMEKTVVVRVARVFKHPLYGKVVTQHKKYKAHDDKNQCGMGDTVQLIESRPISSGKRWAVQKIIEKAVG